ncbi:ABC transporter ATP-binding protein [Lentilactobacillus buchneri]|uniref:Putative hemin import ATP-binding protein HrtA n=1 Tax=Lentilactobacillus buchneri subsp. silagei CD034 TaxID=1071400 RepID=J9VYJ1_LENBU|nr:ABC transporter ATP-binding protein [Lentilactobacillus buchneri]MCC6100932.1 ABC transporter ATP-binding protein [Lactobacillus sp.]AFR99447.1 ABC transporter ATP-binding component [Lentilactobacillus buchneri subsp. silagei CD034]MCT2900874.1 ABC transporter ATP-binding protein [Lentilactobacillus buchneri]MCT3542310.1 ABC transporter ATP-binding protein [Lentilactobacillus buchneri]MCT3546139.1 ABC transporter ATP-binding protein [Lentilactobacillus buchneri]
MSVIELKNINKYFGSGISKVHVLKDVNFAADRGQLILVVGPSGSGKSTFLTIAGGLQTPSSGSVEVEGQAVESLTKAQRDQLRLNQIGFVLQSYNLVPYLKVKEQFEFVDKIKHEGNLDQKELADLLDQLGISQLVNQFPGELSGGQTQRVAIARALYANPDIVLADEPTAALDSEKVAEVGRLFKNLAETRNKAVVVVTHDLRLLDFADKTYEILDGKISLKDKEHVTDR